MNSIIPILLAIGTYTANTPSMGVYLVQLDLSNKTSMIMRTLPAANPSFVQYQKNTSTLYYVEELANNANVNAVHIDPAHLSYQKMSSLPTQGADPCHIAISPDHSTLITSNYSGGNFTTFGLGTDGDIQQQSTYKFESSSIDSSRQSRSHIHSAFYSPDGKRVFVQDLGGDRIYQFDDKLIKQDDQHYAFHNMPAGSGPRHMAFAPNAKYAYFINELNGTIDTYSLDTQGYTDQHLQNIPADTTDGPNLCAHIRISPDGKYLYASNRGDKNTISVFAIAEDGTLQNMQQISCGGRGPRHFELSADGSLLIVANQYTNNVTIFRRDRQKGTLTPTDFEITLPSPVCIALM